MTTEPFDRRLSESVLPCTVTQSNSLPSSSIMPLIISLHARQSKQVFCPRYRFAAQSSGSKTVLLVPGRAFHSEISLLSRRPQIGTHQLHFFFKFRPQANFPLWTDHVFFLSLNKTFYEGFMEEQYGLFCHECNKQRKSNRIFHRENTIARRQLGVSDGMPREETSPTKFLEIFGKPVRWVVSSAVPNILYGSR